MKGGGAFFGVGLLMGGVILLGYVWGKVDLVQVGYELAFLSQKKLALERQQAALRLQLSQLMAPESLARAAKRRLGMGPPRPGQLVWVVVPHSAGKETGSIAIARTDDVEGKD